MKINKRRLITRIILILIVVIMIGFISPLKLVKYDLYYSNLPDAFDGYRILQITDFHCKKFGDAEQPLIRMVKKAQPDIIVLTGDIVDEKHSVENARYLLEGIHDIAPVYYVTGNHEYYKDAPFDQFMDLCAEYGVERLQNETVEIEMDGDKIMLTGLDYYDYTAHMRDVIGYADANYFNVLLYHDSSKFNFVSEYDYDLVLSGHGHGGLIRLPFVGGLLATDHSLFPKYDYGVFHEKNSTMISSSGLGNARVPRWNNPRECVLIKLHKSK